MNIDKGDVNQWLTKITEVRMKTDYWLSDKGPIFFIVALMVLGAAFIILIVINGNKSIMRSIELEDTEARCKSVGGEMGYSKCYEDGKEI